MLYIFFKSGAVSQPYFIRTRLFAKFNRLCALFTSFLLHGKVQAKSQGTGLSLLQNYWKFIAITAKYQVRLASMQLQYLDWEFPVFTAND